MSGQGRRQPCQVAGLPARRAMETNQVAALDPEAPASGGLFASLSATAFGEFEQALRSSQGAGLHGDRPQIQIACFEDVPGDECLCQCQKPRRGGSAWRIGRPGCRSFAAISPRTQRLSWFQRPFILLGDIVSHSRSSYFGLKWTVCHSMDPALASQNMIAGT